MKKWLKDRDLSPGPSVSIFQDIADALENFKKEIIEGGVELLVDATTALARSADEESESDQLDIYSTGLESSSLDFENAPLDSCQRSLTLPASLRPQPLLIAKPPTSFPLEATQVAQDESAQAMAQLLAQLRKSPHPLGSESSSQMNNQSSSSSSTLGVKRKRENDG
jgi:hypothetical protein